jgi:hypothetical protein
MRKLIFCVMLACASCLISHAQFQGIDVDKLSLLVKQASTLPMDNAILVMKSTMTALSDNPMGYRKALEFAESHLGNPADSLHNEELYITCLEHATQSYVLGKSEKDRPRLLLESAKKNRIGTAASDLVYVTPDGQTHHLTEACDQYTLVYFNDPDCDACEKVKARMDQSPTLKSYVDQGLLQVIAIYPEDNQKLWKKASYPAWMINGWDKKQTIENEGTYMMPASLPVFYLLSPDKIVLMKNEPSLNRIEAALNKVMASANKDPQALAALLFN